MTLPFRQSLYLTLSIIIITIVTLITSLHSANRYRQTRELIIHDMKQSTDLKITTLQKNISGLIASYAVNEYDKVIGNEMELRNPYAIIIEDFRMGQVLGRDAYISGKIRDADMNVVDFDIDNRLQKQNLEDCCYSVERDILSDSKERLGKITVYISNKELNKQLNDIIVSNVVNISLLLILLILSLLFAIRYFILKPVSNIVKVISDSDENGIPRTAVAEHGSVEIDTLSDTINNMVSSIKESRIKLDLQNKELKDREDRLQTLSLATEQSPVSVIICDPHNMVEYANSQFEKTTGYAVSDIVGKSIEFLFQNNPVNLPVISEMRQSLEKDKNWVGEISPLSRDGKLFIYRISVSTIANDEGAIAHYIFVAEDITEHKRNEEMLRNSQKMEAVGQLTGGIAHDFNNLLGIIMGNLELLEMTMQDQPKQLERIKQALMSTQRGAQLTRKLLNFSRKANVKQNLVNVNPLLENLVELIARSVTAVIKVKTILADDIWMTRLETGDLEDAILNLCLNARDAMPDGGEIVIETSNRHLDASFVARYPKARQGDYVMISVSDTGTGIEKEALEKIFDPFYSTKPFGKGTGLGLSMVYGFVQRSGGYVHIYSEQNQGTTFQVFLPRATDDEVVKVENVVTETPGGSETILIVDDEDALSGSAATFLNGLGYNTIVAGSGAEALEVLASDQHVDLMFSDVVMPELNGFELSAEALKLHPDLVVLLASGFTSDQMQMKDVNQQLYQQLVKNLLRKPYTLNEMAVSIRRILDSIAV